VTAGLEQEEYTLLEADPGDVIFFDSYVPHGSPANTAIFVAAISIWHSTNRATVRCGRDITGISGRFTHRMIPDVTVRNMRIGYRAGREAIEVRPRNLVCYRQ